jgi:CheY-like chemotaxis protein
VSWLLRVVGRIFSDDYRPKDPEPLPGMTSKERSETVQDEKKDVDVCDDDYGVCAALQSMLDRGGFRVGTVAHSGSEILTKAKEGKLHEHVLLLDYNMPGKDGVEVAEELRLIDPTIAVLFVSADESGLKRANSLGYRTLRKPVSLSELREQVQQLLPDVVIHGDRILIRSKIPESARLTSHRSIALSGETGNAHVLEDVEVYTTGENSIARSSKNYFIRVTHPTVIRHPEHPDTEVMPGDYRFASVRERDVVEEMFNEVRPRQSARISPRD